MKNGKARASGLTRFLRLIRFSHTIFALPFALGALLVATHGRPTLRLLSLVLVCMVTARTAAMLFNRIVDWSLDQRNPRTAGRAIPAKKLSRRFVATTLARHNHSDLGFNVATTA